MSKIILEEEAKFKPVVITLTIDNLEDLIVLERLSNLAPNHIAKFYDEYRDKRTEVLRLFDKTGFLGQIWSTLDKALISLGY